MERRSFLSRASVGAGVGAALVAAPAITKAALPAVRWRCTTGVSRALDTIFDPAERTAKRVSDATGGRFQITVFPAGEIVPQAQIVEAVTGGTVEAGNVYAAWYTGLEPTWAFGTNIPFGMNFRQYNSWWVHGGGEALYNDWLRPRGLRYILSGNTGGQMGGWFRREISTLADLRGLRMRIAGLGAQIMAAAGVVPTMIAPADIITALERGTIDATELTTPHDDEKQGFHRVARFYYHPGFFSGSGGVGWLINNRAWEALPAEYRHILTAAAHEAITDMVAGIDARNPPALRRLIAGGTQLRAVPRPMLQAFWEHSQRIYPEISAANPDFKRLYDHYTAFQREVVAWHRVQEGAYDSMMADLLRPRPAAGGGGEPPRRPS